MKTRAAKIAALISDLTVGFFALVTEHEKGAALAKRRRELTATLNALLGVVQEWEEPPAHN